MGNLIPVLHVLKLITQYPTWGAFLIILINCKLIFYIIKQLHLKTLTATSASPPLLLLLQPL
jgi:hypothetical protein